MYCNLEQKYKLLYLIEVKTWPTKLPQRLRFQIYTCRVSISQTSSFKEQIISTKKKSYQFFFFSLYIYLKFMQKIPTHSVQVSLFFYHSDFTWNQFWGFWKCKSANLTHSEALDFDFFFLIFAPFEGCNIKLTNFRAPKTAFLCLLDSLELISRKIWKIEKSWNFHTVQPHCSAFFKNVQPFCSSKWCPNIKYVKYM